MSLDAAPFQIVHGAPSSQLDSDDPSASILRHAVKIWARDHGVAEDDIPRLTHQILDFANSALRDCARRVHVVV
jgi:hypothetical protein